MYLRTTLSRQQVVSMTLVPSSTRVLLLRLMSLRKCQCTLLCAIWLSQCICLKSWFAMDGSDTSSTFTCSSLCTSWDPDENDHHNMWNPMLGLFCHVQVGVLVESYFDVVLERIALSCHFAPDLPCEKSRTLLSVHF